ncbi:unnamed protein product, partial [Darwinula stevensoni]
GYANLSQQRSSLVYCSITGYGQTGPAKNKPGYDYAVQGQGGLMGVTGLAAQQGGEPVKVGVAVTDIMTGLYASTAILAAVYHAMRTGQGQYIDLALLDVQVAALANVGSNYLVHGQYQNPPQIPQRMGNAHPNIVPYQTFAVAPSNEAENDFVILAVGNDSQFAAFCQVAGQPQWASDPRFSTNAQRVANRELLVAQIAPCMLQRSKAQWLAQLENAGVPCAPINRLDEVFADAQVQARELLQHWNHPLNPELALTASPIRLSATPVQKLRPPPLLGEHTSEILQDWLALTPEQLQTLKTQGALG